MANLTKSLTMPNGQEYEFVGKHWYGTCSTAAGTQNKTVSITGFTSVELVEGVQVTVRFQYAQNFGGIPYLNISNTGAKIISSAGGAGKYEWVDKSIITFCYYNNAWNIIDGQHATIACYGRTILSNTISDDDLVALTPKAVYNAGYITSAALPTKTSDLTNDSGFLTLATLPIWDGGVE